MDTVKKSSNDVPEEMNAVNGNDLVIADAESSKGHHRRVKSAVAANDFIQRYALVGIWIILIIVLTAFDGGKFFNRGTFVSIFGSQQPLIFLTIALVIVLTIGELDLSVASIMGLSATIVAVLAGKDGVNIWLACGIALLAGTASGVINGLIVVIAGVSAIIVTLGMGTLLLGVAYALTNFNTVGGLTSGFAQITLHPVLGLPMAFYYGIALACIGWYVIKHTPTGRRMTFIGVDSEVVRLAGVRVGLIRFGSFVASGVICGLGGIIYVAGLGGYDPSSSSAFILPAFAGAFLGTAVLERGRFNTFGSIIAIYFLVTGITGLELLGVSEWIQDVFYGGALIIAVTISTLVRKGRIK